MIASGISIAEEERFQTYIEQMKTALRNSDVHAALQLAKSALKIRDSEKLRRKIMKMEEYLEDLEEEDDENVHYGNDLYVSKVFDEKLYPYQKDGLRWLWSLFIKTKGGILGDDMGLGKTIQIVTFLASLFEMQKIKTVLIAMPVTLISNWESEFMKWAPGVTVEQYHGSSKAQRERACRRVQRSGGVLLTTYGLLPNNVNVLGEYFGRQFIWDYFILDEGHKIKNATKTTKAANILPSKNRIILTGTPIQNNLSEMWSLFDFAHHGTLLGTMKTFKSEFENPIVKSREKDATAHEKQLGQEVSALLCKRIKAYFLRRTKAEVLEHLRNGDADSAMHLIQKNDFVVWLQLSKEQIRLYQDFLSLNRVKEILMTKRSPLVELTVLKKICDHPRLLSANACAQLGLDGDEIDCSDAASTLGVNYSHKSDVQLIEESGKLKFLMELLANFKSENHRCLVFSQSRVMLDIIERLLTNAGFNLMRIDGTVSLPSERQHRIKKFERDQSYSVFLLTTQVGGVGITLTAADRVVIYDPSWNPATDSQAVDRVYRIGQKRAVVVYRLITCGTVEEKIYRRQVFKHSIHQQTVGNKANPTRYFSRQELKEMFSLEDISFSKTQQQLEQMHAAQRKTNIDLDAHIAFLYSLEIAGISDHDLLFTAFTAEQENIDDIGKKHIGDWIARASKLVEMECEITDKARVEQGGFIKPTFPEEIKMQKEAQNISSVQPHSKSERKKHDAIQDDMLLHTSLNVVDLSGGDSPIVSSLQSPDKIVTPKSQQSIHDTDIRQQKYDFPVDALVQSFKKLLPAKEDSIPRTSDAASTAFCVDDSLVVDSKAHSNGSIVEVHESSGSSVGGDRSSPEMVEETRLHETDLEDSIHHSDHSGPLNSTEIDHSFEFGAKEMPFDSSIIQTPSIKSVEQVKNLMADTPKKVVSVENLLKTSRLRRSSMVHTLINDLKHLQEEAKEEEHKIANDHKDDSEAASKSHDLLIDSQMENSGSVVSNSLSSSSNEASRVSIIRRGKHHVQEEQEHHDETVSKSTDLLNDSQSKDSVSVEVSSSLTSSKDYSSVDVEVETSESSDVDVLQSADESHDIDDSIIVVNRRHRQIIVSDESD